ncbi:MAG: hypothetical protein KC620_07225 [Myxococcales bacterium]|nr:hypothetical protein [Myxococcales bacterium]
MSPPRTLWRFPGPLALQAVLDGAPPTLHHPDAPLAFVGDLRLWAWPGVAEFGALTLFDAAALAPEATEIAGWYRVTVRPLDGGQILYVPDEKCARAVEGAAGVDEARARLPAEYAEAVAETKRAMARYAEVVDRVIAAREQLPAERVPPDWRTALDTPLHLQPPAARAALAAALEAELRR